MNFKKILCVFLSTALIFTLAACEQTEPVSSEVSETPESSVVSEVSEVESTPFVPATDLIPNSEIPEESADFYAVFSQNPIDRQYDADYAAATSFGMMRIACEDALGRWDAMIDIAYTAALDCLQGTENGELQQEQSLWDTKAEDEAENIRAGYGDTNEGILKAEKEIVLLYRSRAMELCEIVYDATGELPSFDWVG